MFLPSNPCFAIKFQKNEGQSVPLIKKVISLHRKADVTIEIMGKLLYFLCFILSVFPADANENRRHIHVTRKGDKKSHRGDTVAKIWIEENGQKKIEICWSELNAKDEASIIDVIDKNWDTINAMIDKVFAGEPVEIIKIRKR